MRIISKKGYLKEAIVNYVSLLGWNPGDEREFFTLELSSRKRSTSTGMSKSPAIFDVNKLTWMNAEYVRRLSPEEFTRHALPYYEQAGVAKMDKDILCRILQPRTEIFTQIPEVVDFLSRPAGIRRGALHEQKEQDGFRRFRRGAGFCDSRAAPRCRRGRRARCTKPCLAWRKRAEMKNGTLLWPVRISLAGKAGHPRRRDRDRVPARGRIEEVDLAEEVKSFFKERTKL